jgi:hypothetical protein
MVLPFKEHFVIDLHRPVTNSVSKHHQYYARKSLQKVHVELCPEPEQLLDEWMQLYDTLIEKHNLKGIRAFSRAAFARQLSIPRSLVFRATREGVTVGMDWYYMQGELGYGHLAAFSPDGYRLAASYALQWTAIAHLSRQARWLDIGAGAGAQSDGTDGLAFQTRLGHWTRTAFCGRILIAKILPDRENSRRWQRLFSGLLTKNSINSIGGDWWATRNTSALSLPAKPICKNMAITI